MFRLILALSLALCLTLHPAHDLLSAIKSNLVRHLASAGHLRRELGTALPTHLSIGPEPAVLDAGPPYLAAADRLPVGKPYQVLHTATVAHHS